MYIELEKRQDSLEKNIWRQVFVNENAMFSNILKEAYQSEKTARKTYYSKKEIGGEYGLRVVSFIPKDSNNYVHLTGCHRIEENNKYPQYQKYVLQFQNVKITFDFSEMPYNSRIIYSIANGKTDEEIAMVAENGEGKFPICTFSELNDAEERLINGESPTIWNIIKKSINRYHCAPSIISDFSQIMSLCGSSSMKPLTEEQVQIMILSRKVDELKRIIYSQGRDCEKDL